MKKLLNKLEIIKFNKLYKKDTVVPIMTGSHLISLYDKSTKKTYAPSLNLSIR